MQRTLAAVDYFKSRDAALPVGVAGYGEGGLIALDSAAADTRIDSAFVSGYFQEREELSQEPNYRNVWGILHEFGDAGVAALVAPRGLVVEAARGPEGPGRPAADSPPEAKHGRLKSPPVESVRSEFERASGHYRRLGAPGKVALAVSGEGQGEAFTDHGVAAFLRLQGAGGPSAVADNVLTDRRGRFDPAPRCRRFRQTSAVQRGVWPPKLPSAIYELPALEGDSKERMHPGQRAVIARPRTATADRLSAVHDLPRL